MSTMNFPSSSSGVEKTSKIPQVFINFRGEELRNGFIAHLENALKQANINYFIDTHEQVGRRLQNLLVRIEQSRVAIVIFSKEYTTSVWCLDELAKINECIEQGTLIGIPIFYRLGTKVVKNLQGYFGDNFRTLKRHNQQDLVRTDKWDKALTSISEIIGIKLSETSDKTDKEFIEIIIEKVKSLLNDIEKEEEIDQRREQVNSQCSMIYARKLMIIHSDMPENWTWSSIKEPPNGVSIEVATMKEVYWMKISGTLHTKKMIPEAKYEVVFMVKLEDTANGWEEPVTLNIEVVNRDKIPIRLEKKMYLDDFLGDEWVEIKAGDFVTPPKDITAKISFEMCQYDINVRKNGLVVKGVAIRAVN